MSRACRGHALPFPLVAENGNGKKVTVKTRTFTTQPAASGFGLPDGRAYEMVSPPDKHGALIASLLKGIMTQASAAGGALFFNAYVPTESQPAGNAELTPILAWRGAGGWQSRDIPVPRGRASGAGAGRGEQYRFLSEDLSSAVLQPYGPFLPCRSAEGATQPCISEAASGQAPFLRTNFASTGEACTSRCYLPLVTGCPPSGQACEPQVQEHADVPAGTEFETGEGEPTCAEAGGGHGGSFFCGPRFVGATPDANHVVIESQVPLTKAAHGVKNALYEWNAGAPAASALSVVSVLPPNGEGKELPVAAELGSYFGRGQTHLAAHAISDDGSRVVWQHEGALYLRDVARGKTIELDAAETCEGCKSGDGEFQFMNAEGTRVLFTSDHKLTSDSGAGILHHEETDEVDTFDLYECEVVEEPAGPRCRLRDLTPAAGGESAQVQGTILGASSDGSYAYFVADGVQGAAAGAVHGTCTSEAKSSSGVCNLYVFHGGVTRLVAVLSGADNPDWLPSREEHPARVSPDGRYLAFMSQRSLTGYDNEDVTSRRIGERLDEEVYLYHAPEDLAAGSAGATSLTCASCDPTGARPAGIQYGKLERGVASGGETVWEPTVWIAGSVPGWTAYETNYGLYQSRYLSDEGRLFFNSEPGLVPADVNGKEDVYEYEPQGTESPEGKLECSESASSGSDAFEPAREYESEAAEGAPAASGQQAAGCLALISSGTSSEESGFLDASEAGGDVFFLTTSQLSPQDYDTSYDIYDAHECTTQSPCIPPPATEPPPCTTEASCKAAPTPQPEIFGAPPSATFNGPGNLAPGGRAPNPPKAETKAEKLAKALRTCRKDRSKKKRKSCEAAAKRRYGSAKKPRSKSHKGRA